MVLLMPVVLIRAFLFLIRQSINLFFFVIGLASHCSTYIPCTRKSFFLCCFCLFFERSQLSDLMLFTRHFSVF